ncbi:MAG: MerR family transcriptional regulator [Acidocella sp.]|nr:MerR family transcriptional regulator [Acidocella sp.]
MKLDHGDEDFTDGHLDDAHPADVARGRTRKSADAFRTISEVADELHVPQHVLRFWETKFPQVRPLKRGGGRRYYRPEDVLLLRRVADLLYTQGYTIKGVQRLLREGGGALHDDIPPASAEERLAAEVERTMTTEPEPMRKPPEMPPQLPMPGLLPAEPAQPARADHLRSDNLRPAQARVLVRQKADPEAERLRALLGDTLTALEQLRALLG